MSYDALIFDNDGVLTKPTDSTVMRDATHEAFAAFDVANPADEHVEAMSSGVTIDRLERVCEEYDLPLAAFWEQRDSSSSQAQQAEISAGRKSLYDDVEALWSLEHPRGIVSSNQHTTIEYIIDHFELDGRFETFYGRKPTIEHIKRKKPDPYFIERAMTDLGTESALYVGDRESDIVAAKNAGVDSAFIRRSHQSTTVLSSTPTYEINDLWELEEFVK